MSIVTIGGKEYNLDPELLKFDEHSINEFLQRFATNYNVFQEAHSDAQYLSNKFEDFYDKVYSEKFIENREKVSSDKSCDLMTKVNSEVIDAQNNMRSAKRNETLVRFYLKSMELAFNSATSFSHNLRRELSMIYGVK